MNCPEARNLFEEAIDHALAGARKRKFDLHLKRCPSCRARYDAEVREHVELFRMLNGSVGEEKLPSHERMTARLIEARRQASTRRSWFGRLPRWARFAASLALLAGAALVAAQVIEGVSMGNAEVTAQGAVVEAASVEDDVSVRVSMDAEIAGGSPFQEEGENGMNVGRNRMDARADVADATGMSQGPSWGTGVARSVKAGVAATLSAAALTVGAMDCVLSVNVSGGRASESTTYPVRGAEAYGLQPVYGAFWCNVPGPAASGVTGLRDQTGQVVDGVSVSLAGVADWTTGVAGGNLFYSYLNDDGTPTITLDGLTAANGFGSTCTVYIYMSTDSKNVKFYAPTVNGTRYTFVDGAVVEGTADWGDTNLGANSGNADFGRAVLGRNCLKIENVAIGAEGRVIVQSGRENAARQRGGLAAVQVVAVRKNADARDLVLSVNFSGDKSDTSVGAVSETAGLVPVSANLWNNVPTHQSTGRRALLWSDGVARDAVTLSNTTANNWVTGKNAGGANLFYSYLDDTSVSVTVDGLTAANGFPATCTAYVYMSCDSSSRKFYPPKINGIQYTVVDGVVRTGTTTWGNSGPSVSGTAQEGVNCLKVENVAIDGGTVLIESGRFNASYDRGGIAAVQLVFPHATGDYSPLFGELSGSGTFSGATWTPSRSDPAWATSDRRTAYLAVPGAGAATVTIDGDVALKSLAPLGIGDLTLAWPGTAPSGIARYDFSDHHGVQRLASAPAGAVFVAGSATYLPDGGTSTVEIPAGSSVVLDGVTWNGELVNSFGGRIVATNTAGYAFSGLNARTGSVRIERDSTLTIHATGGNKGYTVQGRDSHSVLCLTSERDWGVTEGTTFRGLRLATPSDREFWVEFGGVFDDTVCLDLGSTLHLTHGVTIGGLRGPGDIANETSATCDINVIGSSASADGAYSGTIGNFTLRLLSGSTVTLGGAGRLNGEAIEVGGRSNLGLDTTAPVAARNVRITEGELTIGTNACTSVGSLTFAEWQQSWNTIRAVVDRTSGRSGSLHVTGSVDLSRTRGVCEGLTADRPNVLLMTSDVGFTNVDETRDAQRNRLFVGKHLGLPALYFGKPFGGTCIIVR